MLGNLGCDYHSRLNCAGKWGYFGLLGRPVDAHNHPQAKNWGVYLPLWYILKQMGPFLSTEIVPGDAELCQIMSPNAEAPGLGACPQR